MSSSPDSETDAALQQQWETEINRTILSEQPRNLVSSWVLALAFALVVGIESEPSPVFVWLGLFVLMTVIRLFIWWSLRGGIASGNLNVRSGVMLDVNAFVGGLPWGVMGIYFWSLQDTMISAICIFILGGVTSGALPMMSAAKRMYPIFFATCVTPITVRFFTEPTFTPKIMGVVMCFYSIYMIRQAARHREVLWERFRLTAEKDSAIRDLGKEIDDHQQTEEKLRHEKERAEKASQAKTDFVTTMSHEIRTPLNCLVGGVNLIRSKPVSPDLRETVELLDLSSQSLLSIVNDILDFSKIEEGKLEVENAPFPPSKPVEEVYRLYKA
ncbi:MAG: histidine kinase dimerization/phospho-acceptor domain-containing protein, partial [Puniceicoccales bacterium]